MVWAVDPQIEAGLGAIGTLTAVMLFAAPYNTFQRVIRSNNTEDFSPFPYVSTLLNCSVWVIYALPFITPQRTSPLITNVIGVIFQSVYVIIFVRYARDKARVYVLRLLAGYVTFMVLLLLVVGGLLPPPFRSQAVGYCALIFTVIMFASPLSALAVVLKSRSVEYMPLPLSLMGFACSTSWTIYGAYVQDELIILPNLFGMALGLIQLVIYFFISQQSQQGARKASYQKLSNDQEMKESIEL